MWVLAIAIVQPKASRKHKLVRNCGEGCVDEKAQTDRLDAELSLPYEMSSFI